MTPATTIGGRFVIERLAGDGGEGSVYRARDLTAGGLVALKLVAASEGEHERVMGEASILAELDDPGIVRLVDRGRAEDGTIFLAMDWVEGGTLAARLRGGRLTIAESLQVGLRLAHALAAAHARGIVHRDLKPANVIVQGGDVARCTLVDFGIAIRPAGGAELIRTGRGVVGTPEYMSPEQCRGGRVDARSDVFSLGCLLYECVTGERAFGAPHVYAVIARLLFEESPLAGARCPQVPPGLEALLARMMAKDPAARPANGREVAALLHELLASDVPLPPPPTLTRSEKRLVAVVLAIGAGPSSSAAASVELGRIALHHMAELELLSDGTIIAALQGEGDATDLAIRAARLALAERALFPDAAIAVGTSRAFVVDRLPVGDLIAGIVPALDVGGRILVDEVTASLLGPRFVVRDGVLDGERDETVTHPATYALPFVGRDAELVALESAYAECVDGPAARAVIVTADPGMGKTRLAAELVAGLREHQEAAVWIGHADPIGAGSPYAMVARATRRALGIAETDGPELRRRAIAARLEIVAAGSDRIRLAEFLAELVGAPVLTEPSAHLAAARQDALLMADHVARAWQDWVAAECAVRPVVVVLDDLHWGDRPSVRLVETALARLHDRPFFVLALARPEVDEIFPGLWARSRPKQISLRALSARAVERVIRQTLGAALLPAEVQQIAELASGNAFFLEEILRSVGRGHGAALPETVLAMVQGRVDALPWPARRLARAGSVFGHSFRRDAAARIAGPALTAGELDACLATLVAEEVIAAAVEHGSFTFRHAFLRECVYTGLSDEDRRLGHRLAAELLEAEQETAPLVVAEHFDRAGQTERAAPWYLRAAQEALRGTDLPAAIEQAQRGIDGGAQAGTLAALLAVQAEALVWQGAHDDKAHELADKIMGLADETSPDWFGAAYVSTITLARKMRWPTLIELIERLLATVPPASSFRAHLKALVSGLDTLVLSAVRLDLSARVLARIEMLAPQVPAEDSVLRAYVASIRGLANFYGDPAQTVRLYQEACDGFERAGDLRNLCALLSNLGYGFIRLGLAEAAEPVVRRAIALAQRLAVDHVESAGCQNLALTCAALGRLDEAQDAAQRSITLAARMADPFQEGVSRTYLASIHLRAGRVEAALSEARRAVEISVDVPATQALAQAVLAECLLELDEPGPALAASTSARDILERQGRLIEGEIAVRLVHARALYASGRPRDAAAQLRHGHALLLRQAALISDDDIRHRFFEDVPENALTLALAAAWGLA